MSGPFSQARPGLRSAGIFTSSSARSWGTSMKRGVWYFGATLPPRVRQVLPAGTEHVGQSNCSMAAAASASWLMSQKLPEGALCEACSARGSENAEYGQNGLAPGRLDRSQNYFRTSGARGNGSAGASRRDSPCDTKAGRRLGIGIAACKIPSRACPRCPGSWIRMGAARPRPGPVRPAAGPNRPRAFVRSARRPLGGRPW
jgi:hypothetical protein